MNTECPNPYTVHARLQNVYFRVSRVSNRQLLFCTVRPLLCFRIVPLETVILADVRWFHAEIRV